MARGFHQDVVAPLLARELPRLRYAAGRLGSGSDVLGLDDAMSRDHDWGCRLTLLVDEADGAAVPQVNRMLGQSLPPSYRGRPVRFGTTWDQGVSHRARAATVGDFAAHRLGLNPLRGLSPLDWLILTGQGVLEVTAGPVFIDRTRQLRRLRETLCWYPPDIEPYVLAAGWIRVSYRMMVHGRTGIRGDDLGSRVLAARMTDDLMRLAFLVQRRWPPYAKWLGTVFTTLPCAGRLAAPLMTALSAERWQDRERALAVAAEQLLDVQRERGLPAPRPAVNQFWDRPYLHINPAVPKALKAASGDPVLRRLPSGIGSIEQWADSDEVLGRPERRPALIAAYRTWLENQQPDADDG